MIKSIIKRVFRLGVVKEMQQGFSDISTQLGGINDKLSGHDFRIDELKQKITKVEQYQPTYGISGIVSTPARDSLDRCRAIIDRLGGDVAGMNILDIGSSLGYISYYLSDRGASVEGWEVSPQNAEVARLIGQINGVYVKFVTKELSEVTANEIPSNYFDVVIVLSVFHHILRFQGLDATKSMVKTLLERSPVMIVELARKGEDKNLPWDKYQPDDELEIFKGLDVKITKIGSFGNHLSSNERPLYKVETNKQITVNGKAYSYEKSSRSAYDKSPLRHINSSHRKYYFSNDYVIKEYGQSSTDEKIFNVPEANTEISVLTSLGKLNKRGVLKYPYPILVDAEINPKFSRVVIQKTPGDLLSDLAQNGLYEKDKEQVIDIVLSSILPQLAELHENNIYHNDVRSWNIIVDRKSKTAQLIDFGNVGPVQESSDLVQLLWAIHDFITDSREVPTNIELPKEKSILAPYKKALIFYELVSKGADISTILRKVN